MKTHNIIFALILTIGTMLYSFITWISSEQAMKYCYNELDQDLRFDEIITNFKTDMYQFSVTNNEEDALIFFKQQDEPIKSHSDEFTAIDDIFYSPITAFVNVEMIKKYDEYSDYLSRNDNNSYKTIYYINLKPIIEGLLEDKTYKDINFGNNTEKISFIIPDESNHYYKDIVKFIYLTLNNGNELTQEKINELEPSVNKFLEKSKKVKDIENYISEEHLDNHIVISPEFVLRYVKTISGVGITNIKDTNAIYIDMIINNNIKDDFIKNYLNQTSSISTTYFRNIHYNKEFSFSKNNMSVQIPDYVNPIKINKDLKFNIN